MVLETQDAQRLVHYAIWGERFTMHARCDKGIIFPISDNYKDVTCDQCLNVEEPV